LESHPILDRVGVVIPVTPFGRLISQADWMVFRENTGIPVVFDAAAGFANAMHEPTNVIGPIPSIFSFQATKSFGIGEGGCVVSTDIELMDRAAAAINFGFAGERNSILSSINGKLSEYHAAVGSAALDGWEVRRSMLSATCSGYREKMGELRSRLIGYPDVDGSYALFLADDSSQAKKIQVRFDEAGIESRFWYGNGVHAHTHFANLPHDPLPVTESVGGRLIGMPMAPDLSMQSMQRIVNALWKTILDQPSRTTC
jgi:dTDP-4-amino-4,6-dideoxygalactose transaminase